MSQDAPMVTDEVRTQIGKETEWWTYPEPAERGSIRRFAEAIMDPGPLYADQEYASKSRHGTIIAPPTFVIMPPRGGRELMGPTDGLPQVHIPWISRGVNGGSAVEFFRPVRVGDVISQKTRVADVYDRHGRSGTIAIIVYETLFKNQDNALLAVSRRSLIRMR